MLFSMGWLKGEPNHSRYLRADLVLETDWNVDWYKITRVERRPTLSWLVGTRSV